MSLTPFQKEFKKALSTIEIDEKLHSRPVFYAGAWGFARTDENRQKVIDEIKKGNIKDYHSLVTFYDKIDSENGKDK